MSKNTLLIICLTLISSITIGQNNSFIKLDFIIGKWTGRKAIVFRQFNNEGYINQYVLNEELSTNELLVFETETIESFVPGGKARWTIKKISENEIETIFDVYFPNKGFSCFGTNKLKKIE